MCPFVVAFWPPTKALPTRSCAYIFNHDPVPDSIANLLSTFFRLTSKHILYDIL